jgi:uncharacterized membrane protein YdbT with pleckstrin-like domain
MLEETKHNQVQQLLKTLLNIPIKIINLLTKMTNKIFSIHPSIILLIPIYILSLIFFILTFLGIIFPTLFISIFPDSTGLVSFSFWIPISFAILGLILFIAGIMGYFENNFTTYTLTSEDFRLQTGFFSKTEVIIPLLKIQDITLSCSAIQSIFNIGNLIMDTADEHVEGSLELLNIDNPEKYKKQIVDALENINKNGKDN